ncbi:MAG: glycerate kinase family protein [Acidimicrobiales bacterium]
MPSGTGGDASAGRRTVLAAPDKFRGTATAREISSAVARAAAACGWACDQAPLADGGEGTLAALGGAVRHTTVRGPLGNPVRAEWRISEQTAVVEMAQASGLDLVGGPEGNDPLRASTVGTGELIATAIDAGAKRVIVGAGGSATTDGGFGAVGALNPERRLRNVELLVACDVDIVFIDAARLFAAQKGATPAQVELLRRRLERLAQVYLRDYGTNVRELPGSGAAGGLAGGLAAVGATLVGGFDLVAEAIELAERAAGADLVVTGEGTLDAESFRGKAVGGVIKVAREAGVPVLVIVGDVDPEEDEGALPALGAGVEVVSLAERYGVGRALADTTACVTEVVTEALVSR